MSMASLATAAALLSASNQLSLGSSFTSISESIDLDIIEEIIERAPRKATSFPLVYRAYGEVLDEHGLTASSDTAYYQFLLKLGVIRAPTWGEKWDLYKATRTLQSSPRKSRSRHSRVTSADLKTRARVPFLATASSDLDYGFQEGSDDDGQDEADDEGEQMEERAQLGYGRPATRPESHVSNSAQQHRSHVGHTPRSSLDYDALTLNAPIRTSTPVYAQEHHYSHIETSPPLPPYSVSDVSESLLPDDSLSQRDTLESGSTPKARHADLEVEIDTTRWSREEEREMNLRADAFYRTGLLGRCWDVWYQTHTWVKETTEQIDTVRLTILLRQTLQHWQARVEHNLDMASTADNHRKVAKQSRVLRHWLRRLKEREVLRKEEQFTGDREHRALDSHFRRWRMAVNARRTKRWERDMAQREKGFVESRQEQLKRFSFQVWRGQTRDRSDNAVADDFLELNTSRKTFVLWLKRTVLQRKLAELLSSQDITIPRDRFTEWNQKACLRFTEKKVTMKKDLALTRRIWDQWKLILWRDHTSARFDNARLLLAALQQWKAVKRRHDTAYSRAERKDARNLLRRSFKTWTDNERCRLYLRVRDVRSMRRAFISWRERQDDLLDQKGLALQFNDNLTRSHLHRCLSKWRIKLQSRDVKLVIAVRFEQENQRKQLRAMFEKWRGASLRNQENLVTAEKAHAFFLQRQIWIEWKTALRIKMAKQLAQQNRLNELRQGFDLWRGRTMRSLNDRQLVAKVQGHSAERLQRRAFDHWTARVVDIKVREQETVKQRNGVIKREALLRWVEASRRVSNLQTLMYSSIEVRDEENLRNIIIDWRDRAVRARRLRLQAEQSLLERDDRLLVDTFIHWRGRLKERRLEPLQRQVEEIVEDGLMFAVWDRWVSRSTRLPVIAFTKRRLMKDTFGRWKEALETRRKERSLTLPHDHRLLVEVLDMWREKTAQKLAFSTRRRRGRARTSDPLARISSSTDIPKIRNVSTQLPTRPRSSLPNLDPVHARHIGLAAGRRTSFGQQQHLQGIMKDTRSKPRSSATSSDLVRQLRGTLHGT